MGVPLSLDEVDRRLARNAWTLVSEWSGNTYTDITARHSCGYVKKGTLGNFRKCKRCQWNKTGPRAKTHQQWISIRNAELTDRKLLFHREGWGYRVQHFACGTLYWSPTKKPYLCPCEKTSEVLQAKISKTCLRKYGVSNPNQHESIKQKIVNTNIKVYGVPNPMQNPKVREKALNTLRAEYGDHVNNLMDIPEIRAKSSSWLYEEDRLEKSIEKRIRTHHDKYNGRHFFQTQDFRTNAEAKHMEKLGVRNPMQDRATHEKALASGYRTSIYVTKDRRELALQGYEFQVAEFLEARGVKLRVSRLSLRYRLDGVDRVYFPDFDCVCADKSLAIVEVKSMYTLVRNLDMNLAKFRAANRLARKKGWKFVLVVSTSDGSCETFVFPTKRKLRRCIRKN
jgi:hypothetical protein